MTEKKLNPPYDWWRNSKLYLWMYYYSRNNIHYVSGSSFESFVNLKRNFDFSKMISKLFFRYSSSFKDIYQSTDRISYKRFRPILTDLGLCFGLNFLNPSSIFKTSKYIRNFDELFGTYEKSKKKKVNFGFYNGGRRRISKGRRNNIKMGFSTNDNPFNVKHTDLELKGGYHYTIRLQPRIFVASTGGWWRKNFFLFLSH